MSRDLNQDVVIGEERHGYELREDPLLEALEQLPGDAPVLRLLELDCPGKTEATHLADDAVRLDERLGPFEQQLAGACCALDEVLVGELVQGREPGDDRQVVRRERRPVNDGVLHRVEDPVEDALADQARADGHISPGERLRDGHQVGLEAEVLAGEHPAGAAKAGQHLVDAEQRPVAAAERLHTFEITGIRQDDPFPLQRLEQDERDILLPQFRLERVEVVEGHLREFRQQRPETVGELGIPVRREGSRASDRGTRRFGGDDAAASARCTTELDRRLDGISVREFVKTTRCSVEGASSSSCFASTAGSVPTPSCTGVRGLEQSASTSALRTVRLLRPTLNMP